MYGHPGIPIGKVSGGVTVQEANNYAQLVCESGAFPRTHKDKAYEDAVPLYRRLLAESPDSSVVVVSVGFSTNLGRLLESNADRYSPLDGIELVKRKVKFCSFRPQGPCGIQRRTRYYQCQAAFRPLPGACRPDAFRAGQGSYLSLLEHRE